MSPSDALREIIEWDDSHYGDAIPDQLIEQGRIALKQAGILVNWPDAQSEEAEQAE